MKAQQLRNAVLQLAIQGKLVPQDSMDEPVSILLERIKVEKEQLLKDKKIKREKPLAEITDEEKPFDIPNSWGWIRLGDICEYIQRGKSPKYSEKQEIPVIAQKCVQWSGFSIEKAKFIDPETINKYAEERLLKDNDLLWNSTGLGTLGRIAPYKQNVNPFSIAVADSHVTVIRVISQYTNPFYVYYYLKAPVVQSVIEDKAEGSTNQKELYTQTIKDYIIPLPPLAEQQRIMAKIKEIMPLIDYYEKLETEFSKLEVDFPKNLKKSIFQYAVQGKLVEQNKEEDPARDLLEKIKAEKEQLKKDNKIKPAKPLAEITDEEKLFDIPDSWEWVRLGDICEYIQRGKSPKYSEKQEIPVIAQKCVQWSGFSIEKAKFIDPATINKYADERLLKDNDLLWNSTGLGTLGRIAPYKQNANPFSMAVADSHVTVIRIITQYTNPIYVHNYLASPFVQSVIEDKAEGSTKQKELNTQTIKNYLIPLPPLAEQQRIVARVDELLSLCDVLSDEKALNNHMPVSKVNKIIEFKPLSQPDEEFEEKFDMVARAESISPETQAKMSERIKLLRAKK